MNTIYQTAVGTTGERGKRLHVLQGHTLVSGRETWIPICRLNSDFGGNSEPLYAGLVSDKVTCRLCCAALVKIAKERPSRVNRVGANG